MSSIRPSRAPKKPSVRPLRRSAPPARRSSRPPPSQSQVRSRPPRHRVLVVDDDADVRRLVMRVLSSLYDMAEAADGLAALVEIERRPPDLVICDVCLPMIDGLSAFERLQRSPALRRVPFVFITARDNPKDAARGIALGARYYIMKPFKMAELADKVSRVLARTAAKAAAGSDPARKVAS